MTRFPRHDLQKKCPQAVCIASRKSEPQELQRYLGSMLSLSEAAKVYPGIFRVSEDGEETALVQIRAPPFMLSKSGRTKVT